MGLSMILFGLVEESLALLYVMRSLQGLGGAMSSEFRPNMILLEAHSESLHHPLYILVVAATSIITHEFRENIGQAMGIRELFAGERQRFVAFSSRDRPAQFVTIV